MNNPLISQVRTGYKLLITCASGLRSPFLLLIRLYWGWQTFQSGVGHLSHISDTIDAFKGWGVPFPALNVYISGATECAGAIFLLLGVASRLVAIPLVFNFIVAYVAVETHPDGEAALSLPKLFGKIFEDPDKFLFADTAFLFLFASLIILIFGPGLFSVDALIGRCCGKPEKAEST